MSKLVCLKRIIDEGLWAEPPATGGYGESSDEAPSRWAIFRNFLEKTAILMPLDHNSHVFRTIIKNNIFNI